MKVLRIGRRRRRVALVTGVIAAVVLGMALPAWAHKALLSGKTVCSNGDHVVTWTIGNDYNLPMNIVSATAAIGATPYSVTGNAAQVPKLGSTTATSTVPGNVAGTITLTVHAQWTDGFNDTETTTVTLIDNCVPSSTTTTVPETTTTVPETTTTVAETTTTVPETTTTVPETTTTVPETTTTVPETTTTVPETTTTVPETTTTVPETTTTVAETTTTVPETTTTVPETTTTVPETTTTVPQETTTTVVEGTTVVASTTTTTQPGATTTTPVTEQGSTVPTVVQQATTTTQPSSINLPRTGSNSGSAVFFGLSCLAGGALLLIRRRRSWAR